MYTTSVLAAWNRYDRDRTRATSPADRRAVCNSTYNIFSIMVLYDWIRYGFRVVLLFSWLIRETIGGSPRQQDLSSDFIRIEEFRRTVKMCYWEKLLSSRLNESPYPYYVNWHTISGSTKKPCQIKSLLSCNFFITSCTCCSNSFMMENDASKATNNLLVIVTKSGNLDPEVQIFSSNTQE